MLSSLLHLHLVFKHIFIDTLRISYNVFGSFSPQLLHLTLLRSIPTSPLYPTGIFMFTFFNLILIALTCDVHLLTVVGPPTEYDQPPVEMLLKKSEPPSETINCPQSLS